MPATCAVRLPSRRSTVFLWTPQKTAIQAYADAHDIELEEWFADAGYSGRDDERPELRRLFDRALTKGTSIKVILVYASSRFFRDSAYAGWYRKRLEKNGVRVISVTEPFASSPEGELVRQVVEMADELARKNNAMVENARQGFWNGARPPLGYRTETAEVRGDKLKKKLVTEPSEKVLVERIFTLCTEGQDGSGPMGIKTIATTMNARGDRTRDNKRFTKSAIEKILKNEIYIGVRWWGTKEPGTKQTRPKAEWLRAEAPRLIGDELFQKAQMEMRRRAPTVTPPRLTQSDVLLTGLVRCTCGERMLLATSQGKTKLYRYYTCAAQLKNNTCNAPESTRVREGKLDEMVMEVVAGEILTPQFTADLIAAVVERRRTGAESMSTTLDQLRGQLAKAKRRLSRFYDMYADEAESDEILAEKIAAGKSECDNLVDLIERQERLVSFEPKLLDGLTLDEKIASLKQKIARASIQTRKRSIRAIVSLIVVGRNAVEIVGSNAALADAVTGSNLKSLVRAEPCVRGSGREWWSRGESNP